MMVPNQHIPVTPPHALFENRVFCGICGAKMIRKTASRKNNMRVFICPACSRNIDSPAQNFQYPLHDLMGNVAIIIQKERRTAIRTGKKVYQAQQAQQSVYVQQYYQAKINSCMDKTRSIVHSINDLFLDNPSNEPFPEQTMRKYRSLQMEAEKQTAKTAQWADTLLTFLREFHLKNKWYMLYSSIPEDFVLTSELARSAIQQIILTPGKRPEIILKRQTERYHLMNCLKLIDKAKIHQLRDEVSQHGT